MLRRQSLGVIAALFVALGLPDSARADESGVGAWLGMVSWSERRVFYSWQINPNGTFSSGREGRGHDGGGVWYARDGRLTLKYADGFRYEGVVRGGVYSGAAYRVDGVSPGTFSMSRVADDFNEMPDAE